ncbi:hypothetical protein IZ6_08150 [Terrihabitans soli]|uniref:Uncharacterized protein n=1 Tax=Terrihabitans soli TaxID=708113 RepID=A0A6S6QT09_9HYPH|nr:hypothetical protein [Terrihabitans soli]BCJ90080.1 hypothetical protein IZ6_08150 [Terrihabitans soli]
MTKRQFELIALALVIGYLILFFYARDPVCRIGQIGRAGIECAPPPPPPKLEQRPGGGFTV